MCLMDGSPLRRRPAGRPTTGAAAPSEPSIIGDPRRRSPPFADKLSGLSVTDLLPRAFPSRPSPAPSAAPPVRLTTREETRAQLDTAQRRTLAGIVVAAALLSIAATWHYAQLGLTLSHYDAKAHL